MIRTIVVFCFCLLATSGKALASTCVVPDIKTLDNQTVQGYMYATTGKRCGIILLRSAGPIFTTQLVTQANHGRVGMEGNKIVYVSSPGYVGEDHFAYVKKGLDSINRPIARTVEITVKVANKL